MKENILYSCVFLLLGCLTSQFAYAKKDGTDKKVNICHVPPGNTENGQNLSISENGWKTCTGPGKHCAGGHGGDYLGTCSTNKGDSGNKGDSVNKGDSGNKGDNSDRGKEDEEKDITICHIKGKGKSETIHIGFSAWSRHKKHGDYLGSCNNPPNATKPSEDLVVIQDCKGDYRKTLIKLTQTYFDPIIINDDTWDDGDEETIKAISICLDKGDSSDSSKKANKDKTKGKGHDSVSDSGKHHRISGCLNLDSSDSKASDSSKNYAKKLRKKNDSHNLKHNPKHGDSNINISDSSLDDSDVYDEYQKCLDSGKGDSGKGDSGKGDSGKGDSGKGDSGKGDSGHKYRVMSSCSNGSDIKAAIKAHREEVRDNSKYEKRPIILKSSTLVDERIKAAVEACIDPEQGEGKKFITPASDDSNGQTGHEGRLNWREKHEA